jgi:transglutaminase-like putative cysteine protease
VKILKTILLLTIFLFTCATCGCIDDGYASNTDVDTEFSITENPSSPSEIYSSTLKKTEILYLDNGYSLKVLEINRKEEYIRLSFRKDDQEYSTQTIFNSRTFNVKDCNDKNIVYSVTVDKIYDNSFLVQLTYTLRPEILLEATPAEKTRQTVELKIDAETATRYYTWNYDSTEFTIGYQYNTDAYKIYSQRSRNRDYTHFVNDPYDDELISQISTQIENLAQQAGYDDDAIPYIAMAFVQSLPYISDSASSGYDEYTRFPFETLYHGGGDCEDSSILLAAMLSDMNYGVALIELPGHMAVGIQGGQGISGSYYEYAGVKYYYLETTNSGWNLGEIPYEYRGAKALVRPIYKGYPELGIGFSGNTRSNSYYTYVDLNLKLENVGSAGAKNIVVYTSLEAAQKGMVWDQLKSDVIKSLDIEEGTTYTVSNLKVPVGEAYRVKITVWGLNVDSVSIYSDWVIA